MTPKSSIVTSPSPGSSQTNCQGNSQFWYYDPRTVHAQPPDVYARLTEAALNRVWTWDPYLNGGDDVASFGNLRPGISVRMLASCGCNSSSHQQRAHAFYTRFSQRFSALNIALSVRVIDRDVCQGPVMEAWRFHDRYLIVDDDVYAVGASLEYFRARKAPVYIARISDEDGKSIVLKQFGVAWEDATSAKWWCGTTGQFKPL